MPVHLRTNLSQHRQGCSPNSRQIRCTLVGEMPTAWASSRFDQCVAPSGTSSRVHTTTSSTWPSVIVRGTPGRGSSGSQSSRPRKKRAHHLLTVWRLTPSPAATARLLSPSAQASTIRARSVYQLGEDEVYTAAMVEKYAKGEAGTSGQAVLDLETITDAHQFVLQSIKNHHSLWPVIISMKDQVAPPEAEAGGSDGAP